MHANITSDFNFKMFINLFSQVDYFIYLGGLNPVDCAAIYFKYSFENVEEITSRMTWHGTKQLTALKLTRFAQACQGKLIVYFVDN